MFKFTVYFCMLVLTSAAVIKGKDYGDSTDNDKEYVAIVKSVSERKPDGSFIFAYEGADGNFREEVGHVKNVGTDEQEIEVSGSYRYYDADGQQIEVKYTAGKNGFIPVGTNIPVEITEAAGLAAEAAQAEATAANSK